MEISTRLFEGEKICLAPIDHEKDPEVYSRWTHNLEFLRSLGWGPARPSSPAQVKKQFEAIEKEMDERRNNFFFTIRSREAERLLGYIRVYWIEWSHGVGQMRLGIGDAQDRGQGYGSEAMTLLLRFVFDEINLHRVGAILGEDNPRAVKFFKQFGFVEEVRRRQALLREGRTWDILHLGLLRSEWREA